MSEVFVAAYVGDLAAFGINEALDIVTGQWGASGLAVWAGEPPTRRLHLADGEARCVSGDGGATFEPRTELYRSTRMRPPMARDLKRKARFEDVLAACHARSLPVRAIVSASRMGRLCAEHPGAAARDVFDQMSETTSCLSNPDAAALVAAMVEDVSSREGVCGVEVSDLAIAAGDVLDAAPPALRNAGEDIVRALQTCFCESCRQAAAQAGVDADAAHEQARRVISTVLGSRGSASRNAPLPRAARTVSGDGDALTRAYEEVAAASVSRLTATLKRASAGPLLLQEGRARRDPAVVNDTFAGVLRWPEPGGDSVSGSTPIHACIDVSAFISAPGGAADLVRCCRELTQMGYAGLSLHTFGQAPPALSDAVRQAIRIVRRGQP